MKLLLITLTVLLNFQFIGNNKIAASSTSQWSVAQQNKFYSDCMRGAATNPNTTYDFNQGYCSCMLRIVQERYPSPAQTNSMSREEMMRLAKICAAEALSK